MTIERIDNYIVISKDKSLFGIPVSCVNNNVKILNGWGVSLNQVKHLL
jgi:hypothetical protein